MPTRTPVVFIHGNADRATHWDSEITGPVGDFGKPADSVYDTFKAGGYHDCELFGITYLTKAERDAPQSNYHSPETYRVIVGFIEAVKSYTGKPHVDIVAHSLGVSMTIAALTYDDSQGSGHTAWDSVREFVNIAGEELSGHGLSTIPILHRNRAQE